MQKFLFTIVFAATLIACNPSEQPVATTHGTGSTDKPAIEKAVRQTLNDYFADVRQHGLTAEFGYLDSSADFSWIPPGYRAPISYDSVASILNQRAPFYSSISNSWDTLSILPLTNELASYSGRLQSTMVDTAGKSATYTLMETGIVINRGGKWKLLRGQTSVVR